jgi:pilus assembly protein CpaC
LAAALLPLPVGASTAHIALKIGQSRTISTPGLSRVAVGNSTIAGVVPIGTSQVLINGKGPGETTLLVWESGREVVYDINVQDESLDDISAMVKAAVSQPGLKFVTFPNALIVRGTVPSRAAFHQLVGILLRFEELAKAEHFTIVNAVTVSSSFDSIAQELGNAGARNVSVEVDNAGNLIVSGEVDTRQQAEQVLARAQALAGSEFAGNGKLIDRLSVLKNTQIDIKVYVLEVDNTALGNLGISLQSAVASTGTAGGFIYGQPFFPITEGGGSGSAGKAANIGPWIRTTLLAPTLNLLMQTGHARILSSPDLVATSGSTATFLVGGQIPYIYSTGLGQVSIVFKPYGVNLKVTPTLLPNGAVNAQINPDISDLDYQDAVTFAGYTVPALTETSLDTDVIASDGQSIVMGGLLRRIDQQTITKIPILSSLPILGKLFQSKNYQHGETNVVFVMTPKVITSP